MALGYPNKIFFPVLIIGLSVFIYYYRLEILKLKPIAKYIANTENSNLDQEQLYACTFEVYGKVQGVRFRPSTEEFANQIGVKGYVTNTKTGTVLGHIEAPLEKFNKMKHWLQYIGSTNSKIDRVVFSETKKISSYSTREFIILW